jgi:hypothetical protein
MSEFRLLELALPGRPQYDLLMCAKLGFINSITAGGVYTANLPVFFRNDLRDSSVSDRLTPAISSFLLDISVTSFYSF